MQTRENTFWNWFKKFSKTFSFDPKGYLVYTNDTEQQLEKGIKKYDDDLGIIIGSQNFLVELIITAYGDSSKFALVNTLVNAAPQIDNTKIIALKPPADDADFTTTYKGEKINSRDVYFDVYENKNNLQEIGIKVFFPRTEFDKEKFIELAIIMCENIISERRYSEFIELIDVGTANKKDLEEYIPLTRLKAYVDWFINKYVGS